MAMETCFQVTSIASRATTSLVYPQHLNYKEKPINLPRKGTKQHSLSLSRSAGDRRRCLAQFVCQAKNTVDAVQTVTDANWNDVVVGSDTTVLVEFWAPWCGPCRMIAPVIEELAKEYAGKLLCFQVNTDDSPNIATKYGIRSIPTVLLFRNGEKKESVVGAVPKATLTAAIDKYLE